MRHRALPTVKHPLSPLAARAPHWSPGALEADHESLVLHPGTSRGIRALFVLPASLVGLVIVGIASGLSLLLR
jgi:hypothetical protein